MKPEDLYKKLTPTFQTLGLKDVPLSSNGIYYFKLQFGDIFLEQTEIETLVIISALKIEEWPSGDFLLELLQANLLTDINPRLTIAVHKDDKKIIVWGSLSNDNIHLEPMMEIIERVDFTLSVINDWVSKEISERSNKHKMIDKNKLIRNQAESLMNNR